MRNLRLPKSLREELRKPFGKIASDEELKTLKAEQIICVGDESTLKVLSLGLKPKISIVDFRIKREPIDEEKRRKLKFPAVVIKAFNPPGFITHELMEALNKAYKTNGNVRIEVLGEEDLAALAVMATAEDGKVLLYGQPNEGVVLVQINTKVRKKAEELMGKMEEIIWK